MGKQNLSRYCYNEIKRPDIGAFEVSFRGITIFVKKPQLSSHNLNYWLSELLSFSRILRTTKMRQCGPKRRKNQISCSKQSEKENLSNPIQRRMGSRR